MVSDKEFYYKRNRLNQLRGFCSVVQCDCCVSKAAVKNNMEQTTFSKQIMALERDLGTQLFDRSKRKRLQLNKEGELFYKEATRHINSIDGLFQNFNENLKEYNNTHLNIAIHNTAATYIFPSILKKMLSLSEFKDLSINVFVISKTEAIQKLINKEIDIAFYIFAPTDTIPQELEKTKSISDNILLVFNKSHPLAKKQTVTMEDVSKYKFLSRNIKTKTYGNIFKNISDISIEGNSFEIALEIIKQTDNMTTLPELFLKNTNLNNSEIESRNINNLVGEAYFYILLRENKILTKPMEWLIKELKSLSL